MMAQVGVPKAQRKMLNVGEWAKITQDYLTAVQATSDFLESSLQLVDPVVDELLTVKQNAWTIRNYAGSLVLRLLTTMSAGQTWGSTDIVAQAQDSGRVATAWESVTTVAARSDTPKPLVDAVNTAKADRKSTRLNSSH